MAGCDGGFLGVGGWRAVGLAGGVLCLVWAAGVGYSRCACWCGREAMVWAGCAGGSGLTAWWCWWRWVGQWRWCRRSMAGGSGIVVAV